MFVNTESLCVITKCLSNIGVSTNFSAKYTCRSFLLSLFVKKPVWRFHYLSEVSGILVSSLKCFLKPSTLLDRLFCIKLFLKYRSAITSHLMQLELSFRILFHSECTNSRNVFSFIAWLFIKSDKSMIIAESLVLESVGLS